MSTNLAPRTHIDTHTHTHTHTHRHTQTHTHTLSLSLTHTHTHTHIHTHIHSLTHYLQEQFEEANTQKDFLKQELATMKDTLAANQKVIVW